MDLDTLLYRLLLLFGLAAVAVGGAIAVAPDLSGIAGFMNVVLVAVVAIAALFMGLWLIRRRMASDIVEIEIPDVEYPLKTRAPGNDVDEMIYEMIHHRHGTLESRNQIRDRLGELAVQVIMHVDDCTRPQAMKKIQEGTWTENRVAANFFSEEAEQVESRSFLDDLLSSFGEGPEEHPYKRRVRTVVDEIVEYAGMTEQLAAKARDEDDDEETGFLETLREAFGDDDEERFDYGNFDELGIEEEGELVADGVRYRATVETGHWTGVSAFALVALGIGYIVSSPAILLAAAVAAAFAGYSRAGSAPELAHLDVSRTLSDTDPDPGDEVEVTVTVENTGGSFLTDLRIVDRVPARIRVIEGIPRLGTALRPGDTATFKYTIIAERGEHTWPTQIVGRDFSGSIERDAVFEVEETMRCVPRLRTTTEMPVRQQTTVYAGQVNTEQGGSGLEFHSVRDFQQGDPLKRVDWKHFARTGELATIDFRQEKAATVVLLFDARESAYVSSEPTRPHAVDRAVDAADDVFASLYDSGDLVGVAAFDTVPCWLAPGAGEEHLERARLLFANHPAISSLPPAAKDVEAQYVDPMTHVRRQLPSNTQIMMFSPLGDDYSYEVARRLDGAGHLVTVISPDPTAGETPGERMATVERSMRILRLRERGIRVIDWAEDKPLRLEIAEATQRW